MSGFSLSRLILTGLNPTPTPAPAPLPGTGPAFPLADRFTDAPVHRWNTTASNALRPPVIALTGGPCGGKTSLLKQMRLPESLGDARVMEVSELATLAKRWGISFQPAHIKTEIGRFERDCLGVQCALENFVCSSAMTEAKPVVICDRGALDGAAFCEPEIWQHVLADHGVTESQLCNRYDFVLHVTSVAVDKPEFYNHYSNDARWEDEKQAVAQDKALLQAWSQHPNRRVLGNDFPGFEAKMAEGHRLIADFVQHHYAGESTRPLR